MSNEPRAYRRAITQSQDNYFLLRRIVKGLGSRGLRLVDEALTGYERGDSSNPAPAIIISGRAFLCLDVVEIVGSKPSEGLVERHFLSADEPDPVGSGIQGDLVIGGIDDETVQVGGEVTRHLYHVHLADFQDEVVVG